MRQRQRPTQQGWEGEGERDYRLGVGVVASRYSRPVTWVLSYMNTAGIKDQVRRAVWRRAGVRAAGAGRLATGTQECVWDVLRAEYHCNVVK